MLQPIPEYIRWVTEKGELRCLTLEKTTHLIRENGEIASSNDLFWPWRILDTFFNIDPEPLEEMLKLSILLWLPVESAHEYLNARKRKFEKSFRDNMERETWRKHLLYKLCGWTEQKCKANNGTTRSFYYPTEHVRGGRREFHEGVKKTTSSLENRVGSHTIISKSMKIWMIDSNRWKENDGDHATFLASILCQCTFFVLYSVAPGSYLLGPLLVHLWRFFDETYATNSKYLILP